MFKIHHSLNYFQIQVTNAWTRIGEMLTSRGLFSAQPVDGVSCPSESILVPGEIYVSVNILGWL